MKAKTIIITQFISLVQVFASLFDTSASTFTTVVFIISFISFILCALYINAHEKELLREIEKCYEE